MCIMCDPSRSLKPPKTRSVLFVLAFEVRPMLNRLQVADQRQLDPNEAQLDPSDGQMFGIYQN